MDKEQQQIFTKRLVESQAELYAFVRMLMFADGSDVADVVQNINCALIVHGADYKPDQPFRPWLLSFARMQVRKFRQRKAKERERLVFDDALVEAAAGAYYDVFPDGSGPADTAFLLKALDQCKAKLPPDSRSLLEKRYDRNLSLAEIARETRANPHTVSTALGYIRGKLYDCITRLCRMDDSGKPPAKPSEGESAVNRTLDGLDGPGDPEQLSRFLREPGVMRYWVIESHLDALLRWEAGGGGVPQQSPAGRRPWARLGLAAAALILIFGGALWALTRPAKSAAPAAATLAIVQKEASPALPAAAGAAAARAPEAQSITAAVNAATSKEEETVNVRKAAVTAAVAAAAIAPPLAARAIDGSAAAIAAGAVVPGASAKGWLETRTHADGRPEWEDWLETRTHALSDSEGRQTWFLRTIPPPGTIYRFF